MFQDLLRERMLMAVRMRRSRGEVGSRRRSRRDEGEQEEEQG